MTPDQFAALHPNHFYLDPTQPEPLEAHLRTLGILDPSETWASCEIAGEGNMNCTLRVTTSSRSFIVKQARPWVEKYPQFEAPWERILREGEFYRRIELIPEAAQRMPRCLGTDPENHLLMLEDLGTLGDYRSVYQGEPWEDEALHTLAQFLTAIHHHPVTGKFANRAMRELNHAHIFAIPLQEDNGLDLDSIQPGLAALALPYLKDQEFAQAVQTLGEQAYLSDGRSLLHGDFFPGSLMRTPEGPFVIDPEFAFYGQPEFDVAVFLAHLHLAKQPSKAATFCQAYKQPANYSLSLQQQLTGVEIMRRLLGYAQLELDLSLDEKAVLLTQARTWVCP